MLANLATDFATGRGLAGALCQVFRIASVDVNHHRAGFVGRVDRLGYFVRGFRDELAGLLALDTAVAGHADDKWRHSGAHSCHEFMTVSVVKPGGLLR